MTDTSTIAALTPDLSAYFARERERERLEAEARPANRTALFNALDRLGAARAVVVFDGYGDSGQIESIEAFTADDTPVPLGDERIPITRPVWDGSGVETEELTLADAVEALACLFLEQTHGGWENNEGAYGEFSFDVADRTITLEYNERLMTSEYHEHAF
jgi:hypothetical protein